MVRGIGGEDSGVSYNSGNVPFLGGSGETMTLVTARGGGWTLDGETFASGDTVPTEGATSTRLPEDPDQE